MNSLFVLCFCFCFNIISSIVVIEAVHRDREDVARCDTTGQQRRDVNKKALFEHLQKKKMGNNIEDNTEEKEEEMEIIEGEFYFNQHQAGNPAGRYGTVHFNESLYPRGYEIYKNKVGSIGVGNFTSSFFELSLLMGEQDTLVWLGCTPPPVLYFSWCMYNSLRFSQGIQNFHVPTSEISNCINNLVMNTTNNVNHETPYERTTLIISTADEFMFQKVSKAYQSAGFPEEAINVAKIPKSEVKMRSYDKPWILDQSDGIGWQFRASQWLVNESISDAYINIKWPIYLVRPKQRTGIINKKVGRNGIIHQNQYAKLPYKLDEAPKRGTGENQDYLQDSLIQLEKNIISQITMKYENSVYQGKLKMEHNLPDLKRCREDSNYKPVFPDFKGTNFSGAATCDWFTKDALYSLLNPDDVVNQKDNLLFTQNRLYVIMGVNNCQLKKCVYSNMMLTTTSGFEQAGHGANFSSEEAIGSALQYDNININNIDENNNEKNTNSTTTTSIPYLNDLYAIKITRNCDNNHNEPFCFDMSDSLITTTDSAYIVERKYLEPATKTGPSPDEITVPTILFFDLPPPPPTTTSTSTSTTSTTSTSTSTSTSTTSTTKHFKIEEGDRLIGGHFPNEFKTQ